MKKAITFYMNEDTGELEKVSKTELFQAQSCIFRMDIFGDIIGYCRSEMSSDIVEFEEFCIENREQLERDLGL